MTEPLVFARFRKGERHLIGLGLYMEAASIQGVECKYREFLNATSKSAWRSAVAQAAIALGGDFSLSEIYAEMQSRRPTKNRWWKEKVRQVLQNEYAHTGPGKYRIPNAMRMAA